MSRIDINVSAEDPADGELVSRLINSTMNHNGFTDIELLGHTGNHQETNDDVLVAMRNLSPSIFSSEVTIGVSDYEVEEIPVGTNGQEFPDSDDDGD